jgi:hypothetical protein
LFELDAWAEVSGAGAVPVDTGAVDAAAEDSPVADLELRV